MNKKQYDFDLECFNRPKGKAHQYIAEKTKELGFDMASDHASGALIKLLVSSKPKGNILEIGTGTGTATAWMIEGLCPESTLTTIEQDEKLLNVAKEALGHDERVNFVLADGLEYLKKQPKQAIDLIFADTVPGKYHYLEETLSLLKPGGIYIVDDMHPQEDWPEDHYSFAMSALTALKNIKGFNKAGLSYSSGLILMTPECLAN
ncbi:O-methyltransferase [Xenorhabdus japonica]|uniref:O-methyltransferase n=1 Tax=Xenorhabdus japonica TaxID=53341 RepID=A0A1I4YDZ6_9GAMM|nr:methyltransferase domain-containing protein [Xenorhabdus japonica]SFN36003.1 O-methyltransferase [Xenorhabdus japonica]